MRASTHAHLLTHTHTHALTHVHARTHMQKYVIFTALPRATMLRCTYIAWLALFTVLVFCLCYVLCLFYTQASLFIPIRPRVCSSFVPHFSLFVAPFRFSVSLFVTELPKYQLHVSTLIIAFLTEFFVLKKRYIKKCKYFFEILN
jgi:hypothetical protein